MRFILIFLITAIQLSAQTYEIWGKITDKTTNPLPFANIKVLGTNIGTSSNKTGEYTLKLKSGNYSLAASYLGYRSDTANITVNTNRKLDFTLKPAVLELKEVTVFPGKNPANEIIKRAVKYKKQRNNKLNSYVFSAYTKALIKTTKELSGKDGGNQSISSLGVDDSAKLKTTGIIENESKGYYKDPDNYKEEIVARKQTSNTPAAFNILTGARMLQDFYADEMVFFGRRAPSPISQDALDYYYFYLEDNLAMDQSNVFKIYFNTIDKSDPGFTGRIYIRDSLFSLVKVDVNLNDAANPGGIFTDVEVFQQFLSYGDSIYMPIDYRLYAEGTVLGLAKFGFEINSVFYDYSINRPIPDEYFDMAAIKVFPEADEKDSVYWAENTRIPQTSEEVEVYRRIDSLEAIPKKWYDGFAFTSASFPLSSKVAITAPLGIYHFNRVEGNALNFDLDLKGLSDKRFNSEIDLSYGFGDDKLKSSLRAEYLFGDYRTHSLQLELFDRTEILFGETDNYNQLTSTILNLVSKYDFRNYYYSKGFGVEFETEILPVIRLNGGLIFRKDQSAGVNTDFSLFNRYKTFPDNQNIFNTDINRIKLSAELDLRKFIEDGYFRRRLSGTTDIPMVSAGIIISDKELIRSDVSFKKYNFEIEGDFRTFNSAYLDYSFENLYSTGQVPYQSMYALPGNISSGGKALTFRTLRIGEIFGDRVVTFGMEHHFRDELFKMLDIPLLEDSEIMLGVHMNSALVNISEKSKEILPIKNFQEFNHPFYELGFSIGHVIMPLRLEFTWKLNYLGKNNFVFGINTGVL